MAKSKSSTVTVDRRRTKERRAAAERRTKSDPVKSDRRKLERRKKVSRRRQIDPTTCERDYSIEEVEFMQALDEYKRTSGRMFPTCSEILEVIRGLGYIRQAVPAAAEATRTLMAAEGTQPVAAPEEWQSSDADEAADENDQ